MSDFIFDEFAWFVGIFEGEGCIDMAHRVHRPKPRLQIQMTDGDVVRRCHAFAGRGHVSGPHIRTGKRKDFWVWSVQGDDAYALLARMLPYLGERRRTRALEVLSETGYAVHPDQLDLEGAA